jgi:hypothetical protein
MIRSTLGRSAADAATPVKTMHTDKQKENIIMGISTSPKHIADSELIQQI